MDSKFTQPMLFIIIILTASLGSVRPETLDTSRLFEEMGAMKNSIQTVSLQLEKFNTFYLQNLEQKMLSIFTTMSSLDTNIKALQEKAQVWDIFRHHIDAWTDHMKSVDQKIDLIKRTQDSSFPVEAKLASLDFKTQHVFDKVDVVNEKMHDIMKILYHLKKPKKYEENIEENEKSDVVNRLTGIEKQITLIQASHCKAGRPFARYRNHPGINNASLEMSSIRMEQNAIGGNKEVMEKLNSILDKLSTKEFRQLIASNRKTIRTVETLSEKIQIIDDRTVRMADNEFNQYKKLIMCCKNTDHEITTFTNSADLLLKRIEKLVLNLESKLDVNQCQKKESRINESPKLGNRTELIDDEIEGEIGSGEIGSAEQGSDEIGSGNNIPYHDVENDFYQPMKEGCHQLIHRKSGVFQFRKYGTNNESVFDKRYCEFSTNGPAWTVIQRRGDFGELENFNRSWHDYKYGFGDLNFEFWYGNKLIHKLSNEDNQELRIVMEDFDGNTAWAEYSTFYVGSENTFYRLEVGGYRGSVPDSLLYHNYQYFSTYDRNNDKIKSSFLPCAISYGSGWWFNSCAESNLNGIYYKKPREGKFTGIVWEHWLGDYSLKAAKMMIRPKSVDLWFNNNDDEFSETPLYPPEDP